MRLKLEKCMKEKYKDSLDYANCLFKLLDTLGLFESDPTIFRLPNRDLKAFNRRYSPLVTKK